MSMFSTSSMSAHILSCIKCASQTDCTPAWDKNVVDAEHKDKKNEIIPDLNVYHNCTHMLSKRLFQVKENC